MRGGLEVGQPCGDQIRRGDDAHHEESGEPVADRRLREGMDGGDDATSRNEGAEHRQQKGRHDQRHVPLAQHPSFLLHHHRMQERRAGQPWQERGVLHRIPRPVAPPSQLDVRPPHAEQNSRGQKHPRQQCPAPYGAQPFGIQPPGDQGRHRKGERHRGRDVAQIETGWVQGHPGILQLRVHPAPIGRKPGEPLVRVGPERGDQQKEKRHRGQCAGYVRRQLGEPVPIEPHGDSGVHGQDQSPEQQRSRLAGPECADFVGGRQIGAGVRSDVLEREIGAKQRRPQAYRGDHDERQCGMDGSLAAQYQAAVPQRPAGKRHGGAPGRHEKRDPQRQFTYQRHAPAPVGSAGNSRMSRYSSASGAFS